MATIGVKIELEGAPQYKENMQNLTAQTKLYQAQMKRLQSEMRDGVSAFTKSITASKALQQQLEAQRNQSKLLEEQIAKATEKYGEDSTQVIRLKTQYENLQRAIADTSQQLEKNGGIVGAVGAQFEETGKKISSVGQKISSVGDDLTKKVTGPITAIGAAGVKTAASFDSAMSEVAATMGFTVDELNDSASSASKTIEQLGDFAKEMGKTTAFSASEAAQAMNYMALAGYDAETTMKMLPTVLDLASAGGIDLAAASDMVTDAQSALGLSIEETTTMVDQMAKTASKSNTSVAQLGEAILTIGATAKSIKGGTEELNTLLGILADNGIKGAEGGTHLRNMLLSLQNPTDNGIEVLDALGVAVYDAEGNMRSMVDILADMQKGLDGMTAENRDWALTQMFNKTDLASVNALLNTSTERFDELSASIKGAEGAASAMANVKLNNLEGQITLLKSAVEGAAIAIGETLMPYITQLVEKIQGAVDWFNSLNDSQRKMIVQIGLVVAAIGPALSVVGRVVSAIGTVSTSIGSFISFLPKIGALLSSVGALITGTVIPAITGAITAMLPVLPIILGVAAAIAAVIVVVKNWGTITDWISEKWALFTEALSLKVEEIKTFFTNGVNVIKEFLYSKIMEIIAKVNYAWTSIKDAFAAGKERIIQNVKNIFSTIQSTFGDLKNKALSWGSDMIQGFIDGIKAKWEALKQSVIDVANTVKSYLGFSVPEKGPLHESMSWPRHFMENYSKGLESARYLIQTAVGDISQDIAVLENPINSGEIYDAVREGASSANLTLTIGDREFARTLREMGVSFG